MQKQQQQQKHLKNELKSYRCKKKSSVSNPGSMTPEPILFFFFFLITASVKGKEPIFLTIMMWPLCWQLIRQAHFFLKENSNDV